MIFVATDILNPYKRDILSQDMYDTLIDFLLDRFPGGFKRPTDISINGHKIELDDYDIGLNDDDVIVLLDRAALPVGLIGGWFVTALANLAISVTLSYVANKLFAPDAPEEQGTPSSVYNLNSAQNAARYGSPIPIIYGTVRMYPSMIAQPFYRFENNVEYLYHTLCVGQGTNTTDQILIAEDEITSAGDLQWKLLYQSDFYNIPLNGYGFHITNTLETPSNMKLINDPSNPERGESEKYRISKDASKIEIDYIYPNGLSFVRADGSYDKTYTAFTYRIYVYNGVSYTQVSGGVIGTNAYSIDAIQKTKVIDTSSYVDDIYISFEKTYGANDSRTVNDTFIKRVKEIYPNEDFTQLYGDITVLVCKIKATNTVSSAGQLKVNGYFTRTDVGNTMSEVLTDIYTNTTYGGALDANDLSFPVTTETVNCAYDSSMTVFDAMRRPALAQGYSLYLAGMDVILKKDSANAVTTAMYNEMNILRDTFKAQYIFKEEYQANDGYKCTYIDGNGWIQKSETYPPLSSRPQNVDLFGVVDYATDTFTLSSCVESSDFTQTRNTVKLSNGYYFHARGGTNVSTVLFDPDFNFVTTLNQENQNPTGVGVIGNKIYTFDKVNSRFKIYDIDTGTTTYTTPFTGITSIGTVLHVSSYGNYICVAPDIHIYDVDIFSGFLIFDADGQLVSSLNLPQNSCHGAYMVNGKVLVLHPNSSYDGLSQAGGAIGIYSINPISKDMDLIRPNFSQIYGNYGNVVIDLGIENGLGLFMVVSGGIVNANNAGFQYNQFRSSQNRFTLYDYNWNLIGDYSSPITGSTNRTYFGTTAVRHKDRILVGEPLIGTYDGVTESGALHLYSTTGRYIKSLTGNDTDINATDNKYGAGVMMNDTHIMSFALTAFSLKCGYNGNIIDFDIASRMAKYLYKQDDSRRKVISFSTDIQGLVPQFLDKIMVSHSSLQWGEAGEVISRSGDNLVISDELEDLIGTKTIVFRDIDGSVSSPYTITILDSKNITVTGMPAWVANNTFYTVQDSGTAKEFIVISVKPSGDTVQIECVNYDESIYN